MLAEDLGIGDLGCYGQTKIKTPNIDKLAAEGMRFTSYYAGSSLSSASRATLMTGKDTGHGRIRGPEVVPLRGGRRDGGRNVATGALPHRRVRQMGSGRRVHGPAGQQGI